MDFNSIRAACFLSTAVMEFGKAQVALANYPVHASERSSIFNGTCPRVVGVCTLPAKLRFRLALTPKTKYLPYRPSPTQNIP